MGHTIQDNDDTEPMGVSPHCSGVNNVVRLLNGRRRRDHDRRLPVPCTDMPCRGLLVDIDGVLTVSGAPIPGAAAALQRLRAANVPLVFLTNTTALTRNAVAQMLDHAGFPVDVEEILTAPRMTATYLLRHHPSARCLVVGSGDVSGDLHGVTLVNADEQPEVIVLGGAGPEFDYATLNLVFRHAVSGTPVVAMHRNLFWATQDGLQLDTGAFLSAIEQAAGIEAVVIGKPAPACFSVAAGSLGCRAEQRHDGGGRSRDRRARCPSGGDCRRPGSDRQVPLRVAQSR